MCSDVTLFYIHTYNYAERVSIYVPCKLADDAHAYSDGFKEHLGDVVFSWDNASFAAIAETRPFTIRWETEV